jgi:Zn-finger nucleic acid-binding protein
LKCPACHNSMIVVEYHSIELDYCASCHGTWFDKGELELLMRSMELDDSPNLLERIAGQPEIPSTENKRKCPICRRNMKKHFVGSSPQVLVDHCTKQHGLWFDSGELHHLVGSMEAGDITEYSSEQELLVFLGEAFEAEGNCN